VAGREGTFAPFGCSLVLGIAAGCGIAGSGSLFSGVPKAAIFASKAASSGPCILLRKRILFRQNETSPRQQRIERFKQGKV